MQRAFAPAALIIAAAVFLSSGEPAGAQSTGASIDPTEMLRNLTPEQQDAILRQLGGAGTGASGTGTSRRQGETGEAPPEDTTGRRERRPIKENEEKEGIIPVLKGDDWVIIETDFHLPPRTLSQLESLYSAQLELPSPESMQSLVALQALAPANSAAAQAAASQAAATQAAAAQAAGGTSAATLGGTTVGEAAGISGRQALLTATQRKNLSDMMAQIQLRNPYHLSHDGVLTLPGFAGIALLGLTEDQATLRLKAEPAFRDVDIRLTRLPLKKSGLEGLKPFGYDLFDHAPSSFAPVTDVPVPADYLVGPGDEIRVQLYGNQNRTLRLIVSRDGQINFPELGPINVGGQLFSSVSAGLEARVARQLIGVRASVSMGQTRSIRVFVLGEAKLPGSYTISGLGTITSALYAAGGVKEIGSLRNIQLKRRGTLVRTLDLYDMLIRGDTSDDSKLLPGDVVFVPPVGPTVAIGGEVRRPAIYEVTNEATLADVLELAGGLTAQADRSKASLTRIDESQHRIVLRVDLSADGARTQSLRNGDLLQINRLPPTVDSGIPVQGHVYAAGAVAWRDGMRLSDAIHSVDELQPGADIHYLLIRRELPPDRRVAVLSADLAKALRAPGSDADVPLMPRDRITVFDLFSGRDRVIEPLMTELAMQSSLDHPNEVVRVDGRVKVPGEYPLESSMRVADLVRAGGGLADEAYGSQAELTRYRVGGDESRRTELIEVDLKAALRGDPAANIVLEPFDNLSIKETPEWNSQEGVTLTGEVRFPGHYAIRRGETLRSVIARAGGLTSYAFPDGSVFTREGLRKREQEQIDMLASRMQRDLAILALRGAAAGQGGGVAALSVGQTLLSQLKSTKAVGRLVIDLPVAIRAPPGSAADVILRDGDELLVPRFRQEVMVLGEVQNATSHLYRPGLARDDYIALSGGTTRPADRSKIYVVRANGSVVASQGSRWFQHGGSVQIRPGDTIVVPLDTERLPALPFWQAVTGILYNVAIAVAAVHAL